MRARVSDLQGDGDALLGLLGEQHLDALDDVLLLQLGAARAHAVRHRERRHDQDQPRQACSTRGLHTGDARSFLTSASKFNIEPNGGIFDVGPENERASPNVKTPTRGARHAAQRGPVKFHFIQWRYIKILKRSKILNHVAKLFSRIVFEPVDAPRPASIHMSTGHEFRVHVAPIDMRSDVGDVQVTCGVHGVGNRLEMVAPPHLRAGSTPASRALSPAPRWLILQCGRL